MTAICVQIAIAAILVAVTLSIFRLIRGPSHADRIVALDTLSINLVALVTALGILFGSDLFFEAALLVAMMGFIGTVSLSKHAGERSVIE